MLKSSIIFILIIIASFIAFQAWEQTCLGFFQSKRSCEINREYKADFSACAKKSWERCESLDKGDLLSPKYSKCLDEIRCSCMRRHGHEMCDAY